MLLWNLPLISYITHDKETLSNMKKHYGNEKNECQRKGNELPYSQNIDLASPTVRSAPTEQNQTLWNYLDSQSQTNQIRNVKFVFV
jgi:hypothetical protein